MPSISFVLALPSLLSLVAGEAREASRSSKIMRARKAAIMFPASSCPPLLF
jgi:hypothetical protein